MQKRKGKKGKEKEGGKNGKVQQKPREKLTLEIFLSSSLTLHSRAGVEMGMRGGEGSRGGRKERSENGGILYPSPLAHVFLTLFLKVYPSAFLLCLLPLICFFFF